MYFLAALVKQLLSANEAVKNDLVESAMTS